jgi:hypothetical protein
VNHAFVHVTYTFRSQYLCIYTEEQYRNMYTAPINYPLVSCREAEDGSIVPSGRIAIVFTTKSRDVGCEGMT